MACRVVPLDVIEIVNQAVTLGMKLPVCVVTGGSATRFDAGPSGARIPEPKRANADRRPGFVLAQLIDVRAEKGGRNGIGVGNLLIDDLCGDVFETGVVDLEQAQFLRRDGKLPWHGRVVAAAN